MLHGPILVFGSAPLQITVDPDLLSADVDVCLSGQTDELKKLVHDIGLGKGQAAFYIEVVPEYIFRAGQKWRTRVQGLTLNGVEFLFPAAIDILLAKLRRLDEKDLRAFELVLHKTGHPTEDELIAELRDAYDLFYLGIGGQKSPLWANTEKLWPRLFEHTLDVRIHIIEPVLEQLSEAGADRNYIEELRARFGV